MIKHHEVPRLNEFNIDTCSEHLKQSGVVVISNFVTADDLVSLNKEFDEIQSAPESSWIEHRDYNSGVGRLVTTAKIPADFPLIRKIFEEPRMPQLLRTVFPESHLICNEKIWVVKDVVGITHLAQDLHFDVARTLKFFLYLSDTDEVNGAFKCVPGSHRDVEKIRIQHGTDLNYENRHLSRVESRTEEAVSVWGKGGDLIIFDTDTLHMAGKCQEGERRVMRAQSSPVPMHKSTAGEQGSARSFFRRILRKNKS